MVDVARAQSARDAPGEVELLQGAGWAGEDTQRRRTRLQSFGNLTESRLPINLDPLLALANQRTLQSIVTVDSFVAEAIAIGDPDLVDRLVLARHHAHQLPTQHMAKHV